MTPQLPPVLPGFSERIQGPLEHPMEPVNGTDVALLDGNSEWQLGWFDGDGHNFYSLRLGSPIALADLNPPDYVMPLPSPPSGKGEA